MVPACAFPFILDPDDPGGGEFQLPAAHIYGRAGGIGSTFIHYANLVLFPTPYLRISLACRDR